MPSQSQIEANDPTTSTVWISIGRNISSPWGTLPLSRKDWWAFGHETQQAITFAEGHAITIVEGHATWQGDREETRLILATVPTSNITGLRLHLADIAHDYCQEAIGLVVQPGTDTLVEASS